MPNIPSGTRYQKTITVTSSNATLATAATGLDTAVATAVDTLYGALPAGFQAGSLQYCCPVLVYNAVTPIYNFGQQIKYEIIVP